MARLTDTQLVMLSTAGARDDRAVHPLADTLTAGKGTLAPALRGLLKRGLIAEAPAPAGSQPWREGETGERLTLVITDAGLDAIGLGAEGAGETSVPTTTPQAGSATVSPKSSKSESVLKLLRRKRGATVCALQEVTGWQPHTVRAALSGFRKKGVTIEREKNGRGETVYRSRGA
ncbi:DUF3489 domain-containing protein [Oceanibacterium hippocampi]|uniref:DUF3489 domain-containing protein n=1 Tax=Oceanibacterium hippocampi TaxID=745714 RepID=A0A1Y5TTZ0_9PROT|nr:DUF3489 domain-containing protein [Oceanibacterium hippocampi]SLN72337.1 hypothetical protein OCH7691_03461 [Oceanibacterium hippocampi]